MEDDDAEYKTLTRQRSTLRKSSRKSQKGHHNPKLGARQYQMFVGACLLFSWGLAVTVLLILLGFMYTFDTITLTRQDYLLKGAAEWAKAVASKDVMQAIDVWNLINASIVGLVYRSPTDYTNLNNVIAPAFDTMPSLHSVDLGFSDRVMEVTITRKKGTDLDRSTSYMQSNSHDCFLIGDSGCTPKMAGTGHQARPEWYHFGATLKPTPRGGVFYWAMEPELVVESAPDGGDLLSPSIRLIFQVTFPAHTNPGGAPTKAVGRITAKVDALGGERLVDDRLGENSNVYLCDGSGAMMASRKSEDLLTVEDGQVRYKNFWEVGPDWAPMVRDAFTGSSVRAMMKERDNVLVVVEPLEDPLGRFGVIVVVRSWTSFQNDALIGTSVVASLVAPAPYAITGAAAFILFWMQCISTLKRTDGKVGLDALSDTGRVSIKATMVKAPKDKHQSSTRFSKMMTGSMTSLGGWRRKE